jgi:hypothetical protein
MKLNLLSTLAFGAILILAAARPASADPLFTGTTLDDITGCQSSMAYPLDELQACQRVIDDLSAQSKATTDNVDFENISLEMANAGVLAGFLCEQLNIDGSNTYFYESRNLLQAIASNPMSAEIAHRANTMLAMMDKDGI